MTSIILERERDDAKAIVKSAFERTRGIKQYHDDGHRIIGKSGMGIGSYGEQVIVEIPERQSNEAETMLSVSAKKEVSINVTANPEKYKSRFLTSLESLRDADLDQLNQNSAVGSRSGNTKEVGAVDELRDGSSSVGIVMVLSVLLIMLMMFFMMTTIMP